MKTNIFVVGPSGSGKSSSLRNMDPKTTAILNTERKALPFRGGAKFDKNVPCNNLGEYMKHLDYCMNHDEVETIVTESFTSLCEMIYLEGSKAFDGYHLWDYYKKKLLEIFHRAKTTNKYLVFLGIDALVEGEGGVQERYVKVDGSWKKSVEKEFVVVVFTDVRSDENDATIHRFITNKQAGFTNTSVKSPDGMLPPTMDNDLNLLLDYIKEYEQGEEPSWQSANIEIE
jgi:hypothetical protein